MKESFAIYINSFSIAFGAFGSLWVSRKLKPKKWILQAASAGAVLVLVGVTLSILVQNYSIKEAIFLTRLDSDVVFLFTSFGYGQFLAILMFVVWRGVGPKPVAGSKNVEEVLLNKAFIERLNRFPMELYALLLCLLTGGLFLLAIWLDG